MRVQAYGLLRNAFFALIVGLMVCIGPRLMARGVADDPETMQDPMEDMCAGDMQGMIGWCIDTMTAGEMAGSMIQMALMAPSPDLGVFESIDFPGAAGTRALGINPQGDIVGSYTDRTGTHGYILSQGVFTTLDYPGAATTEAWGINPRGDIIGRYTRAAIPGIRGFLLRDGSYSDISIGNHLITLPTKIGASGEIVGCFHDISGLVDMYGYVQRENDVQVFTLPSSVAPAGSAAMHNGVMPGGRTIVGLTNAAPGRTRGYVVTDGAVTYIDAPGSTSTNAWDISSRGRIVGQYNAGGRIHGFTLYDGSFVTLDVPGSLLTTAFGVNPEGHIVGVFNDAAGAHGYLLRK
jgi:uncharacterized membrane protein